MLQPRTTFLALAGAFALVAVSAAPVVSSAIAAPALQELKEKDQEKLGKLFANYIEAREAESEIIEAQEALQKELEKIGKKRAKDGQTSLQAALSLSGDLGRAYYYATDYNKSARSVKPGSISDGTLELTWPAPSTLSYAAWAPPKYKPKDGPYPIILAIPDLVGGKPMKAAEHLMQEWEDGALRGECIIVAIDMPEDVAAWKTLKAGEDLPGGVASVMFVFRELRTMYAIDFDRVFLAGRGPGVDAALEIAARFPHVFAGVIGRAGDAGEDVDVTNFRNLPTFFAGAGGGATSFAERAAAQGFENTTIKADATQADILAWIQDTPREANPLHVSLNARIGSRAYWIAVPPTNLESDAIVDARIDREANMVTVTGEQIPSVEIYFNDQLLDLSKPVKVSVNGLETQHQIIRNLSVALDLTYGGTSDPGRFYVATESFDFPE